MTKDRTPMMHLRRLAVPLALALLVASCSWFGGKKGDEYKGASARVDQPLEVLGRQELRRHVGG